ncbi:ABC transporter ATP-binding protein [Ruania alba]|uniref:ABC-type multidrug transport system, ATPase component n=1 Tax=Ruania alba TaxID=648782 RepID=A0A1H5HG09_9MICO|nr:ATP-binding cassette domain-containing protein [Ruania alba]SEE26684.1 ABC-type multidrug transport system, ATPase component [Ruania alba]
MPKRKTSAPALVRAKSVSVGYGSTIDSAVCPPISVELQAGHGLAIVGSNGTGKSTFLRAVAGLLDLLGGSLDVIGKPVDERAQKFRAEVAVVLDEDSYLPALTVREHLLLTARGHGMREVSATVTQAIEEFGLTARQHAAPTALSSGQRRRLLLAAAFVRPRTLLVLDEPEQRLDSGMRDRLAQRLVDERENGGGVVMATHDPVLVREAATRVVVLAEDQVRVVSAEEGARAIEEL